MLCTDGFDTEIGPSRKIMCLLGIYPDPKKKTNLLYRGYFLFPAAVMIFFCNIPQSVAAIRVGNDLDAVLEVLTTSDISVAIALFKHLDLCYNANVLSQLVLSMLKDWTTPKTNKELEVMWKNARIGRWMSIIIIALAEGTIVAYFVAAVYFNYSEYKRQTNPDNNITERSRPLYLKADFFYDVQKSPVFEITWIFQCLSTIFAASSFSAVDAFFAVLVLHLCGQLNNLKEKMKNITMNCNTKHEESYSVILSRIITRHQYLDRFATNIEDGFNVMFLVQVVVSSVMLCLQGYQLVMVRGCINIINMITAGDGVPLFDLIFMIYFTLCFMFSLFVYCYVAEELRKESMDIGDVAYEINWYNLSAEQTKPLIMIMLRARQPFQISAGKFINFSLELYCKILKTSGGYLSMLLAMKDRLASDG